MKVYLAVGTLLLVCGSMLAQNSKPPQTSGQSTGMPPDMKMGSAQKSKGMPDMKSHMAEMQADMQQMKSRIEKMRSDAEKVQDANTKTALLDNADMWDHFMSQMQSHMDMMMKGGGMHHEGMMHSKKPKTPPAGQTTPPSPK